ncbi:MAG: Uma2 family endonuclease [Dehalococcoidia bacterium]
MAVQIQRRSFTVEEYYKMAQAGILSEDDRVELLDGEIVEMTPIGSKHAACVKRMIRLFSELVGGRAIVSAQDPIRIGERSEPQPDLALLVPRSDFYAAAHPGPEDVLLVIEVAETSADFDRQVKAPLYARAGVREVWLVDLPSRRVEVYRSPSGDTYRDVQTLGPGKRLAPQAFPDAEASVDEILA